MVQRRQQIQYDKVQSMRDDKTGVDDSRDKNQKNMDHKSQSGIARAVLSMHDTCFVLVLANTDCIVANALRYLINGKSFGA